MGSSYVTNPIEFLINTIFGLYILMVMLRFLLAAVRADFYNPVSQFLVKVTNPALTPLRRVIPSIGKLDTSALLLMVLLQFISFVFIGLLRGGAIRPVSILVLSVAELVGLLLNVFLFAILVQVIVSWINPGSSNPAISLVNNLTEPVLRPCRRLLPPISGIDFSPIFALIGIQLAKMLILPPLYQIAH
ncbi:MAG: YggT family protein [Thiogranum sp.]|nr:YggT family protein [Thiogranum sp.]